MYVSRLEYKDDCKVTARVQCLIENGAGQLTGEECSGTIKRLSATDCYDIPVRYKWKICNRGNETVSINTSSSTMKVDGEVQFRVNAELGKRRCITKRKKAIINTCDAKKTTKLSVSLNGDGPKFKECKDYSYLQFEIGDAYPSAQPSLAPSVSMEPSSTPTISHQPSLSVVPSVVPTAMPTSSPSSIPSAKPSVSPTTSAAPSLRPSGKPSVLPTEEPSRLPSAKPTISAAPSGAPTDTPTVSAMPSCVPSAAPTVSAAPSQRPTKAPSPTPSMDPSNSPSKSLSPSMEPSKSLLPSTIPSPVDRRRHLDTKASSKKGKSKQGKETVKKSKNGSPKKINICQD
jgi:hypothetical protein